MWRIWVVLLLVLAGASGEPAAAEFDDVFRQLRSVCVGEAHCAGKFERENADWYIVSLDFATKQLTDGDFQRIGELKTLERLGLEGGEIHATSEGWHSLNSLNRLVGISLPHCLDANAFKAGWDPRALSGIQKLSLPFRASDEVLQGLAGLCKLRSLAYYEDEEPYKRSQQTSDASMAKLADFPDLQRLVLPSQELGPVSLGHIIGLKKLEELDLIGSSGIIVSWVTEAGTHRLSGLSNLRSLCINTLDQKGADALENLREFQRLQIAGSRAESLDLSRFNSIQSLTLATDMRPWAWGKPLQWPPNLQSLCMSAWVIDDGGTGKSVLRHALPASVCSVRLRLFQGSPGICVTPREVGERKASDLTWLKTLPNLAELELLDPLPEDFESILALTHLRRLALTSNGRGVSVTEKQIENLDKLGQLESLTLLLECRTGAALGAIAEIKGLRELKIGAARPGITKLWALSGLEKLSLWLPEAVGGTAVDDPLLGIGALSELKEMTLRGTVTDGGLKNLAGLKKLTLLDLSGCDGFSDVGLAELVKSLPELKTVFWAWHREQKP